VPERVRPALERAALAASNFGVLCITEENLRSPWLLDEAGAISKHSTVAAIVPYLLDVPPEGLPAPRQQFQRAEATREGTWALVQSINACRGGGDR
jgi:hypothetical protein